MKSEEMQDAPYGDELVAHLAFVRRLAHALARDEAAADDLTQDTLFAALRSPPRADFTVRAWLGGIVRRLAWRARRGESRRLAHERAQPPPGPQAPAAETAAILELTQVVVTELNRLGEPYATTLRQRFFDGLDAAAIAAQEGVPVETVRTRVKRGLSQLRERLDARHGGSRDAWALLLVGGAVMSAKAKLLAAAAVVAVIGGGWWMVDVATGPSLVPPRDGVEPAAAVAARSESPTDVAVEDVARERVATPTAMPEPFGILLHGRVIDPAGAPIEDGYLELESDDPAVEPASLSLGASGSFAFGGLAPGLWRLRLRNAEGFEPAALRVRIAAAPTVQCADLVLSPSLLVPIRLVTPDGKRLAEALDADRSWRALRGLSLQPSPVRARRLLPAGMHAKSLTAGRLYVHSSRTHLGFEAKKLEVGDDVDGLLAVPSLPIRVGAYYKHVLLEDVLVETADRAAQIVIDPEDLEDLLATVTVRFVDAASGKPLTDGHVELSDRQSGGGGPRPDEQGVVRFLGVAPGLMHFLRMDDDHEPFETFVEVEPGDELDLGDLALSESLAPSVRIVDEQGRPRRASVRTCALDRFPAELPFDSSYSMGSEQDGRVEHLRIGCGRWLLHASSRDGAERLASGAVVLDATNGAPPPSEIVLRPTTRGRIDLAGADLDVSTVRVTDGAGLPVDWWQFAGSLSWTLELPPGTYGFHARRDDGVETSASVVVGSEPFVVKLAFGSPAAPDVEPILDARPCSEGAAPHASVADFAAPARGILLHGSLLDAAGNPMKPKEMSAKDSEGRRYAGGSVIQGGYAVPGLPPGPCELTIVADGFPEWRERVDLGAGLAVVRHDVVLQNSLQIPVTFLTPDGESLWKALRSGVSMDRPWTILSPPPVTIVLSRDPLPGVPPGRSTQRETEFGRYTPDGGFFSGLDGTLEILGGLPLVANVVFERLVLESRTIAAPLESLEFWIDPARILAGTATVRWRVSDATTGALLELKQMYVGGPYGEHFPDAAPFRKEDGSYEFDRVMPGEMRLTFVADGFEATRCRLLVAPGGTCDLGTIALAPAATIHGRIKCPEGKPARLQIYAIVADRQRPPPFFGNESYLSAGDVEDEFRLPVGRRRVLVSVAPDGFAWQSRVVDATAGDVRDLEIELVKGTKVSLRVPAETWNRFRVEVRDDQDQFVGHRAVAGGELLHLALRPGKYRAVVTEDGATRATREFSVGDTPLAVEIPLR